MSELQVSFDLQDPELVSVYDELPLWSAPFGLNLLDAIHYRPNIVALDIGFGAGFPLIEIAERLGRGSRVYGIDPWSIAVERARKKIVLLGIENVELIIGKAEHIPLPDKSMDLIVSNNGINNVEDLAGVLSECSRLSKPGAQLLATMNLDTTMMEFYNAMEETLRENGRLAEIESMKKHIYSKRKPLAEMNSLIEKNGFRVVRTSHREFRYSFSSGTALLNHHFIKLAFLGPWRSIVPGEQQDGIFSQIEAKLNARAAAEGCIHLGVPFALIESEKQ